MTERLIADRLIAARALDIGGDYLLLLLHRQGEELMRLAVEGGDDLGRDAVAGDGEETDVGAGAVDQLAEAQARSTVGGAGVREIDHGNPGFHGFAASVCTVDISGNRRRHRRQSSVR